MSKKKIKFSVGICAYNEEANIGHLLDNLLKHKTRHQLEKIIVVASGCTDSTVSIVKQKMKKDNRILLVKERKRKGKYSGINKIFSQNKSPFLVMTDADCLLAKGTVDFLLRDFNHQKCGAVVGRTIPLNERENGFWGYVAHFRYEIFHYGAVIKAAKGDFAHISGYLYALRNGLVKKIPQVICDDLYIGVRIKKLGYQVFYEPKAVINIMHPRNLRDFYYQRSNIRLGHLQIEKLTGHRPSNTIAIQVIPLILIVWKSIGATKKEIFYSLLIAMIEQTIAIISLFKMKLGWVNFTWKETPSSKKLN